MFFYTLEIIGTIVFAISGALSACRKNYDLTSVMIIAFAVGNGGGTIRDVLIGSTPVFWMHEPVYVIVSAITAVIVFLVAEKVDINRKSLLIADALGLGLFVIVGAEKTLLLHLSPIVAVMMGVISAVGGGLIRDILCTETPLIFKPEIYATAALAGACIFVPLYLYCPDQRIAGIACALTVFAIRLATMQWHWYLPTFSQLREWMRRSRQGA